VDSFIPRIFGQRRSGRSAPMNLPVLRRVIYDLFEFEASVLDDPGTSEQHCIDREIRFELSDGSCWFASWTSAPAQYSIGLRKESFFLPANSVIRDASNHPLWIRLIGHPLEFVSLHDRSQVVELRSPGASVFLSSQENGNWAMDVLTVSRLRPEAVQSPIP
jgi:hypothetical protein